jgi:phospholipase C
MKRARFGSRLVLAAPSPSLSRRDVLRDAGLFGLSLLTGSCGQGQQGQPPAIVGPGLRPDPSLPEGTDTMPQIEHIIVLMMENHSFDNYFGMLDPSVGFQLSDGVPTAANPDTSGQIVRAFHMPSACQADAEPSQAWNASHTSYADGRNDGFVLGSGTVAMGYWGGDDIPFYYGLARTFPLASRWFCSTLCQTYPNRRFLMAGTAAGIISTNADALSAPPPPNGNIFERLDTFGISWANYHSDVASVAILLDYALAHSHNLFPIDQFYADAASGSLPGFCIVDPAFNGGSEENPDDIRIGEQFCAKVINAAMSGPGWKKTLLVWLYDEHGGYYDHVPPPSAVAPDDIPPDLGPGDMPGGYDRYGFRVPAVIVSPYAKPGYVSSTVRDHTAILKLVERKWNLGALTWRDATADDLSDCLDFNSPPAFLEPPTLPAPALAASNPPACTPGDPHRLPARRAPRQSSVGGPLAEAWGRRRRATERSW